jgi:hypothetical protein
MSAPVRTEADRENAIALAQQKGLATAARETGIPRPTISRWMAAAGLVTNTSPRTALATAAAIRKRELLRARMDNKLLTTADRLLDRINRPHVEFVGPDRKRVVLPHTPASAVQNLAVSVGILIDKYRLESGEATSRSESRDITGDDHEREALRDAIKRELARRHAESARAAVEPSPAPGADAPAVAADAPATAGTA